MAGYRHNPETGQREYVGDDVTGERVPSGLPMHEQPGWVEMFLGPNEHGLPLHHLPRPHRQSGARAYRRSSRRRG